MEGNTSAQEAPGASPLQSPPSNARSEESEPQLHAEDEWPSSLPLQSTILTDDTISSDDANGGSAAISNHHRRLDPMESEEKKESSTSEDSKPEVVTAPAAMNATNERSSSKSPTITPVVAESTKPDPPPSVVDINEEREELDDDILDDQVGREIYTVDENRIQSQILQAALTTSTPPITMLQQPPNTMLLQHHHQQQQPLDLLSSHARHGGLDLRPPQQAPPQPNAPLLDESQVPHGLERASSFEQTESVLPTIPAPPINGQFPVPMAAAPQGAMAVLTPQTSFGHPQAMMMMGGGAGGGIPGGRRKIKLRMEQEPNPNMMESGQFESQDESRSGFLRSIRRSALFGSGDLSGPISPAEPNNKLIYRGMLTISWFEGTSTAELQEHVKRSVIRKLKLPKHIRLIDFRVLDESSDPPEEIVLCPYIPNGSQFLLRFSTRDTSRDAENSPIRPPVSPSAAPSPHPKKGIHNGLDQAELADLQEKLDALRPQTQKTDKNGKELEGRHKDANDKNPLTPPRKDSGDGEGSDDDEMMLHSEDPIEARLRQITELLLRDREDQGKKDEVPHHARRQVVFTLANYFVLFLSFIAISAEISSRAPEWISSLEKQMKNVADCSANQDALFECVSRGDFAGLVASILLWLSRSVATKNIFLFGFDTPHKLWTVVYECLVSAFCWGVSYLFIRRGLNPDTRSRFVQKYWKDAVYGSLAGFNAAFLKQVLKNFIPQEAVEHAMKTQQLKILSWLPNFHD